MKTMINLFLGLFAIESAAMSPVGKDDGTIQAYERVLGNGQLASNLWELDEESLGGGSPKSIPDPELDGAWNWSTGDDDHNSDAKDDDITQRPSDCPNGPIEEEFKHSDGDDQKDNGTAQPESTPERGQRIINKMKTELDELHMRREETWNMHKCDGKTQEKKFKQMREKIHAKSNNIIAVQKAVRAWKRTNTLMCQAQHELDENCKFDPRDADGKPLPIEIRNEIGERKMKRAPKLLKKLNALFFKRCEYADEIRKFEELSQSDSDGEKERGSVTLATDDLEEEGHVAQAVLLRKHSGSVRIVDEFSETPDIDEQTDNSATEPGAAPGAAVPGVVVVPGVAVPGAAVPGAAGPGVASPGAEFQGETYNVGEIVEVLTELYVKDETQKGEYVTKAFRGAFVRCDTLSTENGPGSAGRIWVFKTGLGEVKAREHDIIKLEHSKGSIYEPNDIVELTAEYIRTVNKDAGEDRFGKLLRSVIEDGVRKWEIESRFGQKCRMDKLKDGERKHYIKWVLEDGIDKISMSCPKYLK